MGAHTFCVLVTRKDSYGATGDSDRQPQRRTITVNAESRAEAQVIARQRVIRLFAGQRVFVR